MQIQNVSRRILVGQPTLVQTMNLKVRCVCSFKELFLIEAMAILSCFIQKSLSDKQLFVVGMCSRVTSCVEQPTRSLQC